MRSQKMRNVGRYTRHYLEMVVAMLVGMAVLMPVWALATNGVDGGWLRSTEVDSLVMATTMALPMVAWMRFRGHGWASSLEMAAVMYAGFVVLLPFLWTGALDDMGVMMWGHVLMFTFMALAMLWRRDEYLVHHHEHAKVAV